MAKSATSEEIVAKPEVGRMSWSRRAEHVWAIGSIGLSEVTYYRWRREFGELQIQQVERAMRRFRPSVSQPTAGKAGNKAAGPVGGAVGWRCGRNCRCCYRPA